MKIHPVGAELFRADGRTQTDRHDEAFAILRKLLKTTQTYHKSSPLLSHLKQFTHLHDTG
jgi:hypothetical protein